MIKNVDHIGIAVSDINESNALFTKLLGEGPYKEEFVSSENVLTSFFMDRGAKIELVASTEEDGVIDKFISKRGEGLHHIAFEVDDIWAEMERLRSEGFRLLNEKPKRGADNKWVCFVHPKSANGVLLELCQTISDITSEESE